MNPSDSKHKIQLQPQIVQCLRELRERAGFCIRKLVNTVPKEWPTNYDIKATNILVGSIKKARKCVHWFLSTTKRWSTTYTWSEWTFSVIQTCCMHVCARPMRSFTFKTQLYYWHDNIKAFVHQTVLEKEICMYMHDRWIDMDPCSTLKWITNQETLLCSWSITSIACSAAPSSVTCMQGWFERAVRTEWCENPTLSCVWEHLRLSTTSRTRSTGIIVG